MYTSFIASMGRAHIYNFLSKIWGGHMNASLITSVGPGHVCKLIFFLSYIFFTLIFFVQRNLFFIIVLNYVICFSYLFQFVFPQKMFFPKYLIKILFHIIFFNYFSILLQEFFFFLSFILQLFFFYQISINNAFSYSLNFFHIFFF